MTEVTGLLAMLQHGDSFFPSGAIAFSWGAETVLADGIARSPGEIQAFIENQLRQRWARCDRTLLTEAMRAADDIERVAAIDRLAGALALPRELREGSTRAGQALLGVHERLETPGAAAYRALVRAGRGHGHLPVVQGLVWAQCGLDEQQAAAVAAHGACVAIASAALRLGALSHVDAQRILAALRPLIAELVAAALPAIDAVAAYTPLADIAMMRHEAQQVRLFAN